MPKKEGAMSEIKVVEVVENEYLEQLKAVADELDLSPELNEMVKSLSARLERDLTKTQLAKLLALYHIMVEDIGIFNNENYTDDDNIVS